ncbi:MAG: hypothetical protein ACTSXW_03365, partial [Candidatus Baldrarchaeia archaeon]
MSKNFDKRASEKMLDNIGIDLPKESKNKVIVNESLKSFLDGLLMSGGHLGVTNHATYYFQRCIKREWLEYIQKYLNNHGINSTITP